MRPDYRVEFKLYKWQSGALDPIDGSGLPVISINGYTDSSFWSPDVENYHAEIQVTRDLDGNICRVYIQPLGVIEDPDTDPNEPIPYEVTDKGREAVQHAKRTERDPFGVPYNSDKL